jgi:hypothetical protein
MLAAGYSKDYRDTVDALFKAGLSAHTVFDFPADAKTYPLVLMPSPLSVTDREREGLRAYLAAGGKVLITGPCAPDLCPNSWKLQNHSTCAPVDFFCYIRDGVWTQPADWTFEPVPACPDTMEWQEVQPGLSYNPGRMCEVTDSVIQLCRTYASPMPVQILEAQGYYVTCFRDEAGITLHLLAADYDVDIDHHLDQIRFHRSRVNFVNKVEPMGVSGTVRFAVDGKAQVYTPFQTEGGRAEVADGVCTVTLPQGCAYALIRVEN